LSLPEAITEAPRSDEDDQTTIPHQRTRSSAPRPLDLAPAIGTRMAGQYRVTKTLGAGGMGVVLQAQDELLMRDVAIKLVRPDLLAHRAARGRFLDEARAMARVQHPNVVEIYTFGEHEATPYFVMEFVPGISGDQWFRERIFATGTPPPIDETLGIIDQCCRGVTGMHAADTIHGDIKPSNVLLGPSFRVALTDLGLALMLERGDAGHLAGTPAYMAPESLDGVRDPELAKRRDVYSLGVMTYEFLTGKLPFRVMNAADLANLSKQATPVPPSQLRSDLPMSFDDVLLRALAFDPKARTKSADAFRRELMQARQKASERKFAARILVVDDDADFLALVDRSLRASFPGASIVCASDGGGALDHLGRQRFDLLILDLMLPDLNGVEVVATLRANDATENLPILIVTAFGGGKDWQLLNGLGADGFMVKPVDPNGLASMVGRMLEAPKAAPRLA
jgi:serine/threonine-protein kinase